MEERDSITFEERYIGAKITSVVLKVFGYLWTVGGAILIVQTVRTHGQSGITGGSFLTILFIEIGSTLLGAAVFAFFAYVLDLLRGIWEEVAGENE